MEGQGEIPVDSPCAEATLKRLFLLLAILFLFLRGRLFFVPGVSCRQSLPHRVPFLRLLQLSTECRAVFTKILNHFQDAAMAAVPSPHQVAS